jgi:hypothetical protein
MPPLIMRPFARTLLRGIAAAGVLLACGDDATGPLAGKLDLTMTVDLAAPADSVPLELHVRNVSSRTVSVELFGSVNLGFDPVVTAADGRVVWNYVHGVIGGGGETLILEPGETRVYRVVWDGKAYDDSPLAHGVYTIRGRLIGEDRQLLAESAPREIQLR